MADGGEGTLLALADALGDGCERRTIGVHDPLGREIQASWLLLEGGRAAFIEMAEASGLARLAPAERTPEVAGRASTRGTGELLKAALDAGVERITIGLGGSATTDGGAGLLVALGLRLLDAAGHDLPDGGAALARIARADPSGLDPRLAEVGLTIASDVTNTLTGATGAAATYGPQKGCDRLRRSPRWMPPSPLGRRHRGRDRPARGGPAGCRRGGRDDGRAAGVHVGRPQARRGGRRGPHRPRRTAWRTRTW